MITGYVKRGAHAVRIVDIIIARIAVVVHIARVVGIVSMTGTKPRDIREATSNACWTTPKVSLGRIRATYPRP